MNEVVSRARLLLTVFSMTLKTAHGDASRFSSRNSLFPAVGTRLSPDLQGASFNGGGIKISKTHFGFKEFQKNFLGFGQRLVLSLGG